MRYGLSNLAEAEVEALEAEGIRLTAQDVLRINALACRVETPQAALALSRGVPVLVGGAYLWPLTLAASDWFQRVGGQLKGVRLQTLALSYAMAHGREQMPEDSKQALDAVEAWAKRLTCRHSEIIEGIKQIITQEEQPDTGDDGNPASAGEISVMLAAMTKTDPAIWERQCTLTYALAMLETIVAQNAADGKSTKHDPRIRAERALGLAIAQIRKRHKVTANG